MEPNVLDEKLLGSDLYVKKFVVDKKLVFSPLDGEITSISTNKKFRVSSVVSRLLLCLLSNPNKIIKRSDLMKKVWGDYGFVVGSNSINQSIWAVRDIFESVDPHSNYIRTIPRIGYCFVGNVSIID